MIYSPPILDEAARALVESIDKLRERLGKTETTRGTWSGLLARQVFNRNAGRNGMNRATRSNVGALNPEPADLAGEDWQALRSYRRAMDYVLRRCRTASFSFSVEFIMALHFMITEHNHTSNGGTLRTMESQVLDVEGKVAYRAPASEKVPALIDELVASLNRPSDESPVVRAALVHLNMVRIHPFHDGNGRMARCLQTAVLMRDWEIAPEVASLEEYIGRHVRDHNLALLSTGATWEPHRDTTSWVKFCLEAHYIQAKKLYSRVTEHERLQESLSSRLARVETLPDATLQSLGKVFGVRPSVVGRWWRMRPHRVIEHLIAQSPT